MWPLATLPDWIGLCLWNIAGALAILYAMRSLPLPPAATALAAWLVFKDSLTSLQNAQSNGLVAALMILTVVCWEKQRPLGAGLMLALSLYLKIFGIGVLLLWVLYPQKLKTVVGGVIAAVALFFLPLALTPFDLLIQQYQNWLQMLGAEFPTSEGISVMGMLHAWFGISGYKSLTILMGGMILAAPLLRFKQYEKQSFRLGMLASVLMWVVLFNHRAESPTFVIATAGVAIWFVSRPVTRLNIGLMLFTLLLSGFSSSEIMPAWLQKNVLEPYQLKALPCLLVWLKLQTELWRKPATLAGAQTNLAASTPPVSYQLRAA